MVQSNLANIYFYVSVFLLSSQEFLHVKCHLYTDNQHIINSSPYIYSEDKIFTAHSVSFLSSYNWQFDLTDYFLKLQIFWEQTQCLYFSHFSMARFFFKKMV